MTVATTEIKTGAAARKAGIPTFKFFSDGVLKAIKGADGVRRVTLTASSGADDLVGDAFTLKALNKMKSAAPGTTMFLNHNGHQVPEDVFGAVESADLVTRKAVISEKQVDVVCMDYSVIVEEANPRAVKTFEMIENQIVKLGASVEVGIIERAPNPSNRRGQLIDEIFYITCCVVGVPCNQQSFVHSAMKALNPSVGDVQTIEPGFEPADDAALQDILHKTQTLAAVPGEESQPTVPSPGATADKSADAGTASGEADSSSQAETEEKPVTAADVSTEAIKGMFADAMAAQKPRPYELFDVLCTIMYRLSRLRDANLTVGTDDTFDYVGACREAVAEFALALVDSFAHHYGLTEMQTEVKAIMSIPVLKALTSSWTTLLEKSTSVGEEEREVAQSVHDLSARLLGVTCVHKGGESASGAEEFTASPELVETVNKQLDELETAKKSLEDQLAAKDVELGEWKATAETATELLEKFCKQPLDASPASVASSVAS